MKNKKKHLYSSVRVQLFFIMFFVLIFLIFSLWFINLIFLPKYIESRKVITLSKNYYKIASMLKAENSYDGNETLNFSDKSLLALDKMEANNATSIYIFQLSQFFDQVMYSFDYPQKDKLPEDQGKLIEDLTKDYIDIMSEIAKNHPTDTDQTNSRHLLRKGRSYVVYKVRDNRIGSDYVELFGQIEQGHFIYMRTNYQNVTENLTVFNHFLGYVGLVVFFVSMLLMMIMGNHFTKPILQISDIAKKMSEMDFSVRYPVNRNDEIGELGCSINVLADNLEQTISELKSANNQLEKDIKRKTEIDEMRQEFLSNVSHELKTPIALIQGYAEGLQDNISDDVESREYYCEVIIDEANKMNQMVKKLLTLNQIEFGKEQVHFEHFDIVQVLRNSITSSALLAEQKNANLYMESYEPCYVWADEYLVEEVITNYISNAIHHVSGQNRIWVTITPKESRLRVSVFNTGNQIPEEELDKIWIKFYKVDKARTREYGGSGIGLSIVKAIMDSLNQECGAINHGDSVEFWFELDRG